MAQFIVLLAIFLAAAYIYRGLLLDARKSVAYNLGRKEAFEAVMNRKGREHSYPEKYTKREKAAFDRGFNVSYNFWMGEARLVDSYHRTLRNR